MSRIAGGVLRFLEVFHVPEVGNVVRVHNSAKKPLPGHTGTVISVSSTDPSGSYLIEFANGLRFRYELSELSIVPCLDAVQENPRRGLTVLKNLFR